MAGRGRKTLNAYRVLRAERNRKKGYGGGGTRLLKEDMECWRRACRNWKGDGETGQKGGARGGRGKTGGRMWEELT